MVEKLSHLFIIISIHNSYILSKYSSERSSANLDFRMKLAVFLSNYKQIYEIQRMYIDSIELKKKEKEIHAIYVKNVAQRFTILVIADARYVKNAFMIIDIGVLILNL